jgi:hypothetical protein
MYLEPTVPAASEVVAIVKGASEPGCDKVNAETD